MSDMIATTNQRLQALLGYQKPDRVPIGYWGIPIQAPGLKERFPDFSIASAYENPDLTFEVMLWVAEKYRWDLVPHFFSHTVLGAWDFGGTVQMPRGRFQGSLSIKRTPVQTRNDVFSLKMPDTELAGGIPLGTKFAELQVRHGFPAWLYVRSPFCSASNTCGLERFCRWMMKEPSLCHRLLRMATDHIYDVLDRWLLRFGVENTFFMMSSPNESNQVISPVQFQQFALPYHIELQNRLRNRGVNRFYFHICGDQNLNLPHLVELSRLWPHPSILSFGHEVDLEVAGGLFPKDIMFGNVEPALLQTETPERVYEVCKVAVEKGKKLPGGFILGVGCELPWYSRPGNVEAMTRAAEDHGRYY